MDFKEKNPYEIQQICRDELVKVIDEPEATRTAKIVELVKAQEGVRNKVFGKRDLQNMLRDMRVERAKSMPVDASSDDQHENHLPYGVKMPKGYRCAENALFVARKNRNGDDVFHKFSHRPVYVIAKIASNDDNTVGAKLSYTWDGKQRTLIVDQEDISSRNQITKLANSGVPVTSTNADDLLGFLTAQQEASMESLPEILVTKKSGWSKHEGLPFYASGFNVYTIDKSKMIERKATDDEVKTLSAIRENGKHEQWAKYVKWFATFPVVLFTMGVGLAAPLLKLLRVANFIFHLHGNSTVGKTATSRAAFCFFGTPSDDELLLTWKTTATGLEGRLSLFDGMPVPLDDTSQAPNEEFVSDSIYLIGNAQSKGRGGPQGEAKAIKSFSVTAISTGEKPCSSTTSLRGQEVRTIECGLSPFGDYCGDDLAEKIKEAVDGIISNNGFGATRYLSYLVETASTTGRLTKLREEFKDFRKSLSIDISSPYVLRTIDYFAAIKLSLKIISELLPDLDIDSNMIDYAIKVVLDHQKQHLSDTNNIDTKALTYVWHRIIAEPARFSETNEARDVWGRKVKRRDLDDPDEGYGILPTQLVKILKEGGYSAKSSMEFFKAKGWVWLDKNGALSPISMGGHTTRAYVFSVKKAIHAGVLTVGDSQLPNGATRSHSSESPLWGDNELGIPF